MKQKEIFLKSEGDAYIKRNEKKMQLDKLTKSDFLLAQILDLNLPSKGVKVLEIGCSDGARLSWLKENLGFECYGLDPSYKAVKVAISRGIIAHQGTAEQLPFDDNSFDMVIFGFCLYLCDPVDLFRIACESDRVLKNPGWMLILDFHSPQPYKREYNHRLGLFTHKMNYRNLFMWNPGYTSYTHMVRHFSEGGYTDDPQEWIALSVLRKNISSYE
jgi:ubiquinone/menaquinone biosynthesis C-methylase UbiE